VERVAARVLTHVNYCGFLTLSHFLYRQHS
jgi:hypothetical protein